MKRSRIVLILCLLLCLVLPSCAQDFRSDLSCGELAKVIAPLADAETRFVSFDEDHLVTVLEDRHPADYAMLHATDSVNVSEIGVFRAKDEKEAKDFLAAARDYLKDIQENDRAFLASYAPEEAAKLDSAEAQRFGNYVILCVATSEGTEACFEKAKELLTSK